MKINSNILNIFIVIELYLPSKILPPDVPFCLRDVLGFRLGVFDFEPFKNVGPFNTDSGFTFTLPTPVGNNSSTN